MWRITISDACIGSGSCVGVAPGRFDLDDDEGRSHPVRPEIEPGDEAVLDAVANCPMEAISVVDLATGETVDA